MRVWGSKFAFKNEAKSIKNSVEMGRRFGIDFSSILVGLEGQVGRPNRAKREPKHDLGGQERPQQGKRPRQVNQVKLSQWRRKTDAPYLGGKGFTLP